jgi:uncharacterized membrane protein
VSELIVLGFPSIGGAKNFLRNLLPLQHEHLIQIDDLAYVVKEGNGKSRSSQFQQTALEALLRGSLWGTLAGALFLEPFFGMLIGGTTALLVNSAKRDPDVISRRLIRDTAERKLEPGSSALFLMVSRAVPDKLMQKLHEHDATIITTSLSTEKEQKLRDAWKSIKLNGPLALHNGPSRGPKTQLLADSPRVVGTVRDAR